MQMQIIKTRTVKTPSYGTPGSAGLDFYVPDEFSYSVPPGGDVLIPSGIRVHIPLNTVLIAFNKSGVSTKQKFQVGACVVDCDYTGEIHLHVFNYSNQIQKIDPGQKLVQFILMPYITAQIVEATEDTRTTERGSGGFGSTSLK